MQNHQNDAQYGRHALDLYAQFNARTEMNKGCQRNP
jgi:hypothetical protein